jgi:hypothetical protein
MNSVMIKFVKAALQVVVIGAGIATSLAHKGGIYLTLFYNEGFFEDYKYWFLVPISVLLVLLAWFWQSRYYLILFSIIFSMTLGGFIYIRWNLPSDSEWQSLGLILNFCLYAEVFALLSAVIKRFDAETPPSGDLSLDD